MDRRHLYTAVTIVVVTLGATVWWFWGHTTYQPTTADQVLIAGEVYEVRRFVGVVAPDEPEKQRACFRIDRAVVAPPELEPRPTPGPDWLTCFNAGFITESLARGEAQAYVAARDDPEGWDRVVAVLPGQRVYMWHQPRR